MDHPVWPLRLVWLLVCCLYKEVYLQIFKCVSFWLHGCCGEWEGGPVNQVNHTSWVAVVTPTDRPMSVRNCCLIELVCGVVCVVTLPFWHFCWCRGFCHMTGSDLLLFVWTSTVKLCNCELKLNGLGFLESTRVPDKSSRVSTQMESNKVERRNTRCLSGTRVRTRSRTRAASILLWSSK